MAKRSSKRTIRLVAIAAVLSTGGTLIVLQPSANAEPPSTGTADAANCERNKFEVKADRDVLNKWSVYGDLYAGNGEKVYHWEEEGRQGNNVVRWEFTYCGDGGWANIWINPNGRMHEQLNLKLDRNYCWKIGGPKNVFSPIVRNCFAP